MHAKRNRKALHLLDAFLDEALTREELRQSSALIRGRMKRYTGDINPAATLLSPPAPAGRSRTGITSLPSSSMKALSLPTTLRSAHCALPCSGKNLFRQPIAIWGTVHGTLPYRHQDLQAPESKPFSFPCSGHDGRLRGLSTSDPRLTLCAVALNGYQA